MKNWRFEWRVLRSLVAFALNYPVGRIYRPFWRAILRYSTKNSTGRTAIFNQVGLLFEAREDWKEVAPLLQSLEDKRKMDLARTFSLLYLHNRRWDEAIAAASFWNTVAAAWVRENPDQSRKIVRLHRKLYGWALGASVPANWARDERAMEFTAKFGISARGA